MGDILFQAQGEDVVAGTHIPQPLSELKTRLPDLAQELFLAADRIERHYRDMADIEFTVQDGRLYILQARVGKRTPQAAARLALEMCNDPNFNLSRQEALARLPAGLLEGKLGLRDSDAASTILAHGIGASPGSATGQLVFDADEAVDRAEDGWSIILARQETCPADVHGMGVSAGIVTALGGLMSHAAVVARGWAIPAVVGARDVDIRSDRLIVGDKTFYQGDIMSIDGTSGAIFAGDVSSTVRLDSSLDILRGWARDLSGQRDDDGAQKPITTRPYNQTEEQRNVTASR